MSGPSSVAHVGYVLLTHGPKHSRAPLAERPGAAPQIERIERFLRKRKQGVERWRHDYVREPEGPSSFPVLFALLKLAKEHDASGFVVLDDLERLFAKLPHAAYKDMAKALDPYRRQVLEARRGRLVSDMSNEAWLDMLRSVSNRAVATGRKSWQLREVGPAATERARRLSRIVRGSTADQHARLIAALMEELSRDGRTPSNVELARAANERGMLTSRGKPWSDVAVGRALKRFSKSTPDAV